MPRALSAADGFVPLGSESPQSQGNPRETPTTGRVRELSPDEDFIPLATGPAPEIQPTVELLSDQDILEEGIGRATDLNFIPEGATAPRYQDDLGLPPLDPAYTAPREEEPWLVNTLKQAPARAFSLLGDFITSAAGRDMPEGLLDVNAPIREYIRGAGEDIRSIGAGVENQAVGDVVRAYDDPNADWLDVALEVPAAVPGVLAQSVPDMVAMSANLPAYMQTFAEELNRDRIEKGGEDDLAGYAQTLGGSALTALLDRFGLEKVLKAAVEPTGSVLKSMLVGIGAEAPTEAAQEINEYLVSTYGTDEEVTAAGAKKAGALGAMLGGPVGGVMAGGAELVGRGGAEQPAPEAELSEVLGLPAPPDFVVDAEGQARPGAQEEPILTDNDLAATLGITPDVEVAAEGRRQADRDRIYEEEQAAAAAQAEQARQEGFQRAEGQNPPVDQQQDAAYRERAELAEQERQRQEQEAEYQRQLQEGQQAQERAQALGEPLPNPAMAQAFERARADQERGLGDQMLPDRRMLEQGAPQGQERRQGDRRQDTERRKRVAEMSPDEMRAELMTSQVAGIPNRRAYEEAPRKPVQVAMDVDSLKWVNDNLGHEAGDQLLRAVGDALAQVEGETYHVSGDEFVAQADTEEQAQALMAQANELLQGATIEATTPDGRKVTIRGIGVSHGTGGTLGEADTRLQQQKSQREASGARAARGEAPPTAEIVQLGDQLVGGSAEGQPDRPGDTAGGTEGVAEPDVRYDLGDELAESLPEFDPQGKPGAWAKRMSTEELETESERLRQELRPYRQRGEEYPDTLFGRFDAISQELERRRASGDDVMFDLGGDIREELGEDIRRSLSDLLYGDDEIPTFKTQREFAEWLEERAGEPLPLHEDATREVVSKIIALEAFNALEQDGNAGTWYRDRVEGAKRVAGLLHPEILTDPAAEVAFEFALAVTSNGMPIADNVKLAEQAYAAWKATGEMPLMGKGPTGPTMQRYFEAYNRMVEELGQDRVIEIMEGEFTVGELNAIGKPFGLMVGDEQVSTRVFGSSLFGPKIGGGFFQNLHGNFAPLTMDRWFMRTWGRIVGDLTVKVSPATDQKRLQAFRTALTPEAIKASGVRIGNAATARSETLRRAARALYRAYARGGFKDRSKVNTTAKALVAHETELQGLPANARARTFIRQTIDDALSALRDGGVELEPADLQALIWYPEKDLYARAGVSDASGAPTDYQTEFERLARDRGVTDERIKRAVSARTRGVGAGRSRGRKPGVAVRKSDRRAAADSGRRGPRKARGVREGDVEYGAPRGRKAPARADASGLDRDVQSFADLPPAARREAVEAIRTTWVENVKTGSIDAGLTHVHNAGDAARVFQPFTDRAQENLVAIVTNKDGKILEVQRHSIGTTDSAQVDVAVLAGGILSVRGATDVWLAHNHPSGNEELSSADLRLTDAMTEILTDTGVGVQGMLAEVMEDGRAGVYSPQAGPSAIFRKVNYATPTQSTKKAKVTERIITKRKPGWISLTGPEFVVDYVREELPAGATGILLLDNRHKPVGFVAMTDAEMSALRQRPKGGRKTPKAQALEAIHGTNANAAIIVAPLEDTARNAAKFLNSMHGRMRVLDVVLRRRDGTMVSSGERNLGIEIEKGAYLDVGEDNRQTADRVLTRADELEPDFLEAQQALQQEINQRLQDVGISDEVAGRAVGQLLVIAPDGRIVTPAGSYGRRLIKVAMREPGAQTKTLNHELIHALRDMDLFTDAEWRVVVRAAKRDPKFKAKMDRRYRNLNLTPEKMDEEYVAEFFAEWEAGRRQTRGAVQRIMERIRDFFAAIRRALQARGYETAEEIFAAINRGTFGTRVDRSPLPQIEHEVIDMEDFSLEFPATDQDTLGFYSALTRAARAMKQEKGTPAQMLATLTKMKGVKAEELRWSGLPEFLEGAGRTVTKHQMVAFLESNGPRLGEVVRDQAPMQGKAPYIAEDIDVVRMHGNHWEVFLGREKWPAPMYIERVDADEYGTLQAMVLYNTEDEPIADAQTVDDLQPEIERVLREQGVIAEPGGTQRAIYGDEVIPGGENYQEFVLTVTPESMGGRQWKNEHFPEVNVIAHIRTTDRVIDGKRTLLLEEIQSDLHQQGQREGYAVPGEAPVSALTAEDLVATSTQPGVMEVRRRDNGRFVTNVVRTPTRVHTEAEAIAIALDRVNDDTMRLGPDRRVPNAPFQGDTWAELALKRALRLAAENGYEQLGIPSSEAVELRTGADLEVWQDERLPAMLKKVLKGTGAEVYGVPFKVDADAAAQTPAPEMYVVQRGSKWVVLEGMDENPISVHPDRATAERAASVYSRQQRLEAAEATPPLQSAVVVPITPELREQIMVDGMPMFDLGENQDERLQRKADAANRRRRARRQAQSRAAQVTPRTQQQPINGSSPTSVLATQFLYGYDPSGAYMPYFLKDAMLGFQRLFESASDRLRRIGMEPVARLVDRVFDEEQRNAGEWNRIMASPVRKATQADREAFGTWARAWDQGEEPRANALYGNMSDTGKALVDAWKRVADHTGTRNQQAGVQVFDPKLKKMRPIGKAKHYFPRKLAEWAQNAIYNPMEHPEDKARLVTLLIDEGLAADAADAERFIRANGPAPDRTSSDYFSAMEKARTDGFPPDVYDYSVDTALDYGKRWAERLAQIEVLGQDGTEFGEAFDRVIEQVQQRDLKQYLRRVKARVYNESPIDPIGRTVASLNMMATGLQLGNPRTAMQNLITGSGLNYLAYGRHALAGQLQALTLSKQAVRDAEAAGVLRDDILQVQRDLSESANVALSKFTGITMRFGGYNITERMIRLQAYLAGKSMIRSFIRAVGANPTSASGKRWIAWMQRNNFDYEEVLAENGQGPATDRVLRYIVNMPQGSYKVNMTPVLIDEPVGRFLFKYQKYGTQVTRMVWMNHMRPFLQSLAGGERIKVRDPASGEMVDKRAFDFMSMVRLILLPPVYGYANKWTRWAAFGTLFALAGPDWEDIEKALEDEGRARAAALALQLAWESVVVSGVLGIFQTPVQIGRDVSELKSIRNPLDPPGLGPVKATWEMGQTLYDQGTLTGGDIDFWATRTFSLYNATVGSRPGRELQAAMGFPDKPALNTYRLERAQVQKEVRSYAQEHNLPSARRTSGGSYRSTPQTPINREVSDAIILGRPEQAQTILRQYLDTLDNEYEIRAAVNSVKAHVRNKQPIVVGGQFVESDRTNFLGWAKTALHPDKYARIVALDRKYRSNAQRAGLLTLDDPAAERRAQRNRERKLMPMNPGQRARLYRDVLRPRR